MSIRKPHDIDMSHFSRFRSEYMGVAMLAIILFHVALPRSSAFFGLRRMGNIGVDVFLFLSGMGLWFSWMKSIAKTEGETFLRRWASFYRRRLLRVYPTWLVIACLYYIPRYHSGAVLWRNGRGLLDLFGDILINWDFWLHDELTFWYMPAIILLYAVAPFYLRLTDRHAEWRWLPVLLVCWCAAVQWVCPIHEAVGHIEIFWSRAPIFFIGINMGAAVRDGKSCGASATLLALVTVLTVGGMCIWLEQFRHGHFPLFVERMMYIPLTVAFLLLLGAVLRHTPPQVRKALAFVGALSLEVYLIHLNFVLLPLAALHWGYWENVLGTLAITLPAAWMLRYIIAFAGSLRKNKDK